MISFCMLKELKEILEKQNYQAFNNIELKYDELVISAKKYIGYILIKELVDINELANQDVYTLEHLSGNVISQTECLTFQ